MFRKDQIYESPICPTMHLNGTIAQNGQKSANNSYCRIQGGVVWRLAEKLSRSHCLDGRSGDRGSHWHISAEEGLWGSQPTKQWHYNFERLGWSCLQELRKVQEVGSQGDNSTMKGYIWRNGDSMRLPRGITLGKNPIGKWDLGSACLCKPHWLWEGQYRNTINKYNK